MADTDLEVRIKRYLAENEIIPITDNILLIRLLDIAKTDKQLELLLALHALSKLPDMGMNEDFDKKIYLYLQGHKQHYILNECRASFYAVRVAMMRALYESIQTQLCQEQQSKQGLTIMDYGCGYGLDLCFLAKEFPDSKFEGYDIDTDKLTVARQRAKRYAPARVQFIKGNYYKPDKAELAKAEVLYTTSPISSSIGDGKLKLFLNMMKERVKIGGVYVLMGISLINTNYVPH